MSMFFEILESGNEEEPSCSVTRKMDVQSLYRLECMCRHSTIKWNHLSNCNQSMKLNLFFATPIMQDIIESNLTDYVLNMAAF